MPNLTVDLAPNNKRGLHLQNPVMTASGTFGYGVDYAKIIDLQRLGAIVAKTTTLLPYSGNPQPRIAETPAGMLNAIGVQNAGVDAIVSDLAPQWARWRTAVVVSILGATPAEYAEMASRLDGVEGVAGLEVNISSPNAKRGGMQFGQDPESASEVARAVRRATSLPVVVKLSPNVADIVSIARAVADEGADAICLINTLQGMAIDVRWRRPVLSSTFGGLSGPAIKPVALRMVYQVARALDVPLAGCGGISTGTDAIEFLMAGASAVQIGTATFANPRAPLDVLDGIEQFMRDEGIDDVHELIGAANLDRARSR